MHIDQPDPSMIEYKFWYLLQIYVYDAYHICCIKFSTQTNFQNCNIYLNQTTINFDQTIFNMRIHMEYNLGKTTFSAANILKASKARKRKYVGIGTSSLVLSCMETIINTNKKEQWRKGMVYQKQNINAPLSLSIHRNNLVLVQHPQIGE